MPVIDLDRRLRADPQRAVRRRPRLPVLLAAAFLLLGLSGEPGSTPPPGSFDRAVCDHLADLSAPTGTAVLTDVVSGEVAQTTIIESSCP